MGVDLRFGLFRYVAARLDAGTAGRDGAEVDAIPAMPALEEGALRWIGAGLGRRPVDAGPAGAVAAGALGFGA